MNKHLRIILKTGRWDTISTKDTWGRSGQIEAAIEIKQRKYNWIGHIQRNDAESIKMKTLDWYCQWNAGWERPQYTGIRTNTVKIKKKNKRKLGWRSKG